MLNSSADVDDQRNSKKTFLPKRTHSKEMSHGRDSASKVPAILDFDQAIKKQTGTLVVKAQNESHPEIDEHKNSQLDLTDLNNSTSKTSEKPRRSRKIDIGAYGYGDVVLDKARNSVSSLSRGRSTNTGKR